MPNLDDILIRAKETGASDVHVKSDAPVALRIDGDLQIIEDRVVTPEELKQFIRDSLSGQQYQDLEINHGIDFSYIHPEAGRFRTNVFRQSGQWSMAMRRVNEFIPDFEGLNLPPQLAEIASDARGVVLVAGATGCGKSTTLAAMLNHVNLTQRQHIITLEDPVEFIFNDEMSRIEQREIGIDTQSFKTGLRNILRQDPDVIMIGEMRDADSFETAVSAADTGHHVMTTLHTSSATTSLRRILEFFPPDHHEQIRHRLAAALHAIISQRMCRTQDGQRIPAVEILITNPTIRKLIEDGNFGQLHQVIEGNSHEGMQTFNQSLRGLVTEEHITMEEAMRHSDHPGQLHMLAQGISIQEDKRILSR